MENFDEAMWHLRRCVHLRVIKVNGKSFRGVVFEEDWFNVIVKEMNSKLFLLRNNEMVSVSVTLLVMQCTQKLN